MTLEEKIKKINKIPHHFHGKLKPLGSVSPTHASTIAEFWRQVVDPMLPDYDTMKKWHKLLIDYVDKMPDPVVFMIRKGNEESREYMETVPADALRRGFLTKTTEGYWFVYNDNDFATYMLSMVLDGDVIDSIDAAELLSYLQTPNSIIRFNKNGKGGVERNKAYFKINGTQPRISQNGYTVAHIFDVNAHYYDASLGFDNTGGEDALKSMGIDKGRYSEYTLQGTFKGRNIYYRDGYMPGVNARMFLKAHMLRFLHPLNYFCAPKDNMNGCVYCEFTDHINNGKSVTRRFARIAGYEHLLYYAHHKFKEKYGDIYEEFLSRVMLPKNTFDFFENSSDSETSDFYGSEVIDAKYGNPLSSKSSSAPTVPKVSKPAKASTPRKSRIATAHKANIDLTKISKLYLESFKVGEIAYQVLGAVLKSGKVSKADIDAFKSATTTKAIFGFGKPLLSPVMVRTSNINRYYSDNFTLYGETLYLYSQWLDVHKERLIKWILNWIAANGGKI